MSTKKLIKQIKDKKERSTLQKLVERYNLQDFNLEVEDGHLSRLAIKFKNLTSIPSEIEIFAELKELDLSRNQIKKIGNLTSLINLEKLNLRNNEIEIIEHLETLVRLRELELSDNQITKIQGLMNLRLLEVLELSRNKIKKIEGLERCTNLRILKLSNNPIEKIEGLDNLARLEVLLISKGHISKIEGLEKNTHLRELNLAMNQIEKIENLEKNILLRILNLSDNQIKELENLEELTFLQEINLERNNFNPEDLIYITKPASIIVAYCKQKKDRKEKNIFFRKKIKEERDNYQIQEELQVDTEIAPLKKTRETREKMIKEAQKRQEKVKDENLNDNKDDNKKINEIVKESIQNNNLYKHNHKKPAPMPLKNDILKKKNLENNYLDRKVSDVIIKDFNKDKQKINENQINEQNKLNQDEKQNPDQKNRKRSLEKLPVPNPQIRKVKGEMFETEEEWLQYANKLNNEGDYTNALLAYRNVIQLNTRNYEAWVYSGIAFNNKNDFRRAIRAFKQALAIIQNDPNTWVYLGIAFYNSGDFENAANAFIRSLELDPSNELAQEYFSQIPEEYREDMQVMEKQAALLAQHAQEAEDKLLTKLKELRKAFQEISFEEVLQQTYNPPYITDIKSLKQKITDLVLQDKIALRIYLDHIKFLSESEEPKKERKIVNLDEQFKIDKLLAFTNLSQLWLAEDWNSGEYYVLKHILFKGDLMYRKINEQIALREIAILSKIKSKHVIPLINSFIGEHQGNIGYVLQLPYYEHGTLEHRLNNIKENFDNTQELLPAVAVLSIFSGLISAVIAVHKAEIIHRDIKPANIIINTPNTIPTPEDIILIDFGIATSPMEIAGTDFSMIGGCGTRGFSAPEQLESVNIDYGVDSYAIGATIYYTITLQKYNGEFIIPEYTHLNYQDITFIYPILQRLLEPNPSNRIKTIEELERIKNTIEQYLQIHK